MIWPEEHSFRPRKLILGLNDGRTTTAAGESLCWNDLPSAVKGWLPIIPFHFGMVMVMATQIGAVTPPVAVGLFVATSISRTTYDQTLKYCFPFVLALLVIMLMVIFIPPLSSWLPNHFLGAP